MLAPIKCVGNGRLTTLPQKSQLFVSSHHQRQFFINFQTRNRMPPSSNLMFLGRYL